MTFSLNLLEDEGWHNADGYSAGTKQKVLRDDNGGKTILLKLPKNFHMEAHSHLFTEQHFVLEGSYIINNNEFGRGSYQRIPANESHGSFASEKGAIIMIIWDRPQH